MIKTRPFIKPDRMARGMTVSGTPTNTAVQYLYNDTTGTFLLAVLDVNVQSEDTAPAAPTFGIISSTPGGSGSRGSPILSGEGTPPGLLFTSDTASPPPTDYIPRSGNFFGPPLVIGLPMAVLQPGSAAFVSNVTAAKYLNLGWIWAWLTRAELDRLYDFDYD